MKNTSSLWLIPSEDDELYLRNIIDSLAKEYNSPSFIPHLSLLAEAHSPLETLKSAAEDAIRNEASFELNVAGISQSDFFWKTVFIEFDPTEKLKDLFEKINSKTEKRDPASFKPHISLIYKNLEEPERIKIANKIKVKDKFTFNRVMINLPKIGDEDFNDIKNWRIGYDKNFA